jgi:hypothetical protein
VREIIAGGKRPWNAVDSRPIGITIMVTEWSFFLADPAMD